MFIAADSADIADADSALTSRWKFWLPPCPCPLSQHLASALALKSKLWPYSFGLELGLSLVTLASAWVSTFGLGLGFEAKILASASSLILTPEFQPWPWGQNFVLEGNFFKIKDVSISHAVLLCLMFTKMYF